MRPASFTTITQKIQNHSGYAVYNPDVRSCKLLLAHYYADIYSD